VGNKIDILNKPYLFSLTVENHGTPPFIDSAPYLMFIGPCIVLIVE